MEVKTLQTKLIEAKKVYIELQKLEKKYKKTKDKSILDLILKLEAKYNRLTKNIENKVKYKGGDK